MMQVDFFGTADHAEALQLSEFELATAKQLAYQANKNEPGAAEVAQAKKAVKRWNSKRVAAGLRVIV